MAWNRGVILGSNASSGGGSGAVTSVAGRTGDVVLTGADVGAGQLPAGVLLPAGVAIPSGASATTQAANDNSTKVASTAYADAAAIAAAAATAGSGSGMGFGPHNYASIHPSMLGNNQIAVANANDCRFSRIIMAESGHLRDLSVYIATANAGNGHLIILDTGQANATHTVATCLAISGNLSQAATGWLTYDPNLAVTKGDTLYVCWQSPDTVAKIAGPAALVAAAFSVMPANYLTSSGAGTTAGKLTGHILAANVPNAVNGTVTDANVLTSLTGVGCFLWRIS